MYSFSLHATCTQPSIHAFDVNACHNLLASTGAHPSTCWQIPSTNSELGTVVHDESLIAASPDGILQSLNLRTGAQRWSQRLNSLRGAPVVYDGIVFATSGSELHAICNETGLTAWSAQTSEQGFTSSSTFDGVLYCAAREGTVFAIEPATGELFWKYSLASAVDVAPATTSELVIVRTADGYVHALDQLTGAPEWQTYTGWTFDPGAMVATDTRIVVLGPGNQVHALEADSGTVAWNVSVSGIRATHLSSIGSTVVVAATLANGGSMLTALDRDSGQELWRTCIAAGLTSGLHVSGANLLAGDNRGSVHALDHRTGSTAWSMVVDQHLAVTSVTSSGSYLIVSTSHPHELNRAMPGLSVATKRRSRRTRN